MGKHRSQLINELGSPRSETPLSDGGSRLLYFDVTTFSSNGKYRRTVNEVCRIVFDADQEGIIQSATFYGCSKDYR